MGKYVYLPKPIYVAKPFFYAIVGFTVAMLPDVDVAYKLAGLMFGTIGVGYILNRIEGKKVEVKED